MSETLNYYGNYKSCYFLRRVPVGETDFSAEDEQGDEAAGHDSCGLLNQMTLQRIKKKRILNRKISVPKEKKYST